MQNGTRVTNVKNRKVGTVKSQCQSSEYVLVQYDHEFILTAERIAELR